MLSVSKYSKQYIQGCRAKIDVQLTAYDALVGTARGGKAKGAAPFENALAAFEPGFANHMLLAHESYFMHRARNLEGKDGNALNETRVLCTSLIESDGVMTAIKVIRLKPEDSLLGYRVGDRVELDVKQLRRLSDAFFAEIELRYT